MNPQPIKKQANEQDWLNSIKQVFAWAKKQKPPQIAQSEIEAMLLGLRGQTTNPLYPKQLSPAGKKAEQMLQGYLDIMKKKNKRFLKISESVKRTDELFGKKFTMDSGEDYFMATITKNTISSELPYRLSWFKTVDGGRESKVALQAAGHIPLTEKEAEEMIRIKKFPESVTQRMGRNLGHAYFPYGIDKMKLKDISVLGKILGKNASVLK